VLHFHSFLLLFEQIRLSSEDLDSLTVNRSEWPNKTVRSGSTRYDEPVVLQYSSHLVKLRVIRKNVFYGKTQSKFININTVKLMSFPWTYLLLLPAVGEMQRCYPDSIVQPRKWMFWPQHGHAVMCLLSVAWNYRQCVRAVLLNRSGARTRKVLGKFSSTRLENILRIC
jgi:hypothetical protein